MFFEYKDFLLVPKYSFVQKIAKTDNLQLRVEFINHVHTQEYEQFDKIKILKILLMSIILDWHKVSQVSLREI